MNPKKHKRSTLLALALAFLVLTALSYHEYHKVVSMVQLELGDHPILREDIHAKLDKDQKAQDFYKYHNDQMNLLLNQSSIMDWKRLGKFKLWLRFFDYGELYSNTTVDILLNLPQKNYRFFHSENGLCLPAKLFTNYYQNSNNTQSGRPPLPHVLMAKLGNDFGALSTQIPGVTGKFGHLIKEWKNEGCSKERIFDYLNHPDTLAVFTTQFQIYNHPKVISLPLGLPQDTSAYTLSRRIKTYSPLENRTNPLMINMQDRPGPRSSVQQHVMDVFRGNYNISLLNSYKNYGDGTHGTRYCHRHSHPTINYQFADCYHDELLQSKFIVSPSGLGLDCFRHWEALLMGAIPILERSSNPHHATDGWAHQTLSELPVAWIDRYQDLTPSFLEREYHRLVYQVPDFSKSYNYRKLTKQYWVELAYSIARGDIVLPAKDIASK